jgi:hypothetical protein
MENLSSIIRRIINDLLRSLSAALVHIDDLIMRIERDSDEYSDAILTNEQLSRSIEIFLNLRVECNYFLDQLFINNNSLEESAKLNISQFNHNVNEVLTNVSKCSDLILKGGNNKKVH